MLVAARESSATPRRVANATSRNFQEEVVPSPFLVRGHGVPDCRWHYNSESARLHEAYISRENTVREFRRDALIRAPAATKALSLVKLLPSEHANCAELDFSRVKKIARLRKEVKFSSRRNRDPENLSASRISARRSTKARDLKRDVYIK